MFTATLLILNGFGVECKTFFFFFLKVILLPLIHAKKSILTVRIHEYYWTTSLSDRLEYIHIINLGRMEVCL